MIKRDLEKELLKAATETPVVALLGPRQSGKTTLARYSFPNHIYVNLEDLELRRLAQQDPKRFLSDFPNEFGIIIDEAQRVPDIFSYVQVKADELRKKGYFILTGSQNFTMHEAISQSLAGRVSLLTLLPLSIHELVSAGLMPETIEEQVFKGCYPNLYDQNIPAQRLYKNYLETYIERDVRQILNVTNLSLFQEFIIACASRSGQLLNLTSISEELGISQNTVKSWLSVLQASYIIVLLKPYYRKYSKRLVKSPKLYFVDSGLACFLLGITSDKELQHSYLRGSLIETLIVSDLYKQFCNIDHDPRKLYFWRDQSGHEVDVIIDRQPHPVAIEIKSGKTVSPDYFTQISKWNELTKTKPESNYIIYSGFNDQVWPGASVVSWKSSGELLSKIY